MANIRLVAFVALFIFLSFPPTLHSKGIKVKAKGDGPDKFVNDALNAGLDFIESIFDQGESSQPDNKPPMSITEAKSSGFYTTFSVGDPTQSITAQVSISSVITIFENYKPTSTSKCCTKTLSCSQTNCNGNYYVLADTFIFEDGNLSDVPYIYDQGKLQNKPTGFLSFSRHPYSLLMSTAQSKMFSYYFSDSSSSFTIGSMPITTELQSTKLVTIRDYPHLYDVELTQISIGTNSYQIDPTTSSSKVILDTVTVATLLETGVYAKVKTELLKLGNAFYDKDNGLELCFYSKPNWPDLTLFFPSSPSSSAGAQMVLTRNNYVVTVDNSAECAAIYESKLASVIGIMAQINRQMVFDLSNSEPRLSFSQYASSGSATVPSVTAILIFSLFSLVYLYVPV